MGISWSSVTVFSPLKAGSDLFHFLINDDSVDNILNSKCKVSIKCQERSTLSTRQIVPYNGNEEESVHCQYQAFRRWR